MVWVWGPLWKPSKKPYGEKSNRNRFEICGALGVKLFDLLAREKSCLRADFLHHEGCVNESAHERFLQGKSERKVGNSCGGSRVPRAGALQWRPGIGIHWHLKGACAANRIEALATV